MGTLINIFCRKRASLMPHLDRYNTSKLLEILVVHHLASLAGSKTADSSAVVMNTVNPGFCHSELTREFANVAVSVLKALIARTTEEGSRVLVLATAAGKESHGQYFTDGHVERYVFVIECRYLHLLC